MKVPFLAPFRFVAVAIILRSAKCENELHKPVLPLGAKGIRGDDFAIAFGGDKIVFTFKLRPEEGLDRDEAEKHYTVQAGKSGVIDLHETRSIPQGTSDAVGDACG